MDYQRHYYSLISRAKSRLLEGYVEKHHIVPKCMGGTDDIDNLVVLTPEEHFLAHQLLCKIYPNEPKLLYAAKMMTVSNKVHKRTNNKLFGWLKRRLSASHISRKSRRKETKPRNRNYVMSDEQKQKISYSLRDRKLSEQTKKRISESNIKTKAAQKSNGFKRSKHTKSPHTAEAKSRMSAAQLGISKPQRKVVCPHCGKTGALNNMVRYHFDQCPNHITP